MNGIIYFLKHFSLFSNLYFLVPYLKNLVISNSNIGLAAYIKKQEYNPSTIKIDKFSTTNNKKEFFFEEGSKVMINERVKEDSEVDVFVKIYPPEKIN